MNQSLALDILLSVSSTLQAAWLVMQLSHLQKGLLEADVKAGGGGLPGHRGPWKEAESDLLGGSSSLTLFNPRALTAHPLHEKH